MALSGCRQSGHRCPPCILHAQRWHPAPPPPALGGAGRHQQQPLQGSDRACPLSAAPTTTTKASCQPGGLDSALTRRELLALEQHCQRNAPPALFAPCRDGPQAGAPENSSQGGRKVAAWGEAKERAVPPPPWQDKSCKTTQTRNTCTSARPGQGIHCRREGASPPAAQSPPAQTRSPACLLKVSCGSQRRGRALALGSQEP